jgi:hypothetical protein
MTRSVGPFRLGPASLGQLSIGPVEVGAVAIRAAAALLGTGCVVWAAVPLVHQGWANLALVLAIAGVAAGALRLALAGVPAPEDDFLLPVPVRAWLRFLETLRRVPWEEGAVIALVWLEVMHRSRPWHTAVLGAAAADRGRRADRRRRPGAALCGSAQPAELTTPGAWKGRCRDIQGGAVIAVSSWGLAAYDEAGQAGRWGFTSDIRRAGADG